MTKTSYQANADPLAQLRQDYIETSEKLDRANALVESAMEEREHARAAWCAAGSKLAKYIKEEGSRD